MCNCTHGNAPPPVTHTCNVAKYGTSLADQVAFTHATLCTPVPSTFKTAAAKGFLHGFPGMDDPKKATKLTPNTVPTAKGHLNQKRQNVKPTQHAPTESLKEILQ